MRKTLSKFLYVFGTATACLMMISNTGCVSGGWELTRDYSKWLNSKKVALRVVLYILTMPVFFVTILIDTVVNNTIDFWNGTVTESTQVFYKDDKTYYLQHELLSDAKLRRTTIQIQDASFKTLQTIILAETLQNEVELIVDGVIRTKVENIDQAFPLLSTFDENGKLVEEKNIFIDTAFVAKLN